MRLLDIISKHPLILFTEVQPGAYFQVALTGALCQKISDEEVLLLGGQEYIFSASTVWAPERMLQLKVYLVDPQELGGPFP